MIEKLLSDGYRRNQRIIEAQIEGLTHETALTQSPFNVNCMNWVLGHIDDGRDDLLEILGRSRLMDEAAAARYRRESDPITQDGPDVLPLDVLLALLSRGQRELSAALGSLTPEQLEADLERGGRTSAIAEWAQFFYFHDTYHTGQTELLRQMSGKSDKVI